MLVGIPGATAAAGSPTDGQAHQPQRTTRRLTLDTNLHSASRLSAWQIDRFLATYTRLPPLGHAFKAAEAKYGVNARYLLAHAMLESDYGRSYIARRFHNLFGWNALDRDPVRFATRFASFADCIDFVARRIARDYLDPNGRYYGGAPTLRGMRGYATDPGWARGVRNVANSLDLPNAGGLAIRFDRPAIGGLMTAGQPATITVGPSTGAVKRFPDGLRVAARFVPIAVVEANAPVTTAPDPDPAFRLVTGLTRGGRIEATVVPPDLPGRYRLEFQVRDSDGTRLRDGSRFAVPALVTRAYGANAVTFGVGQVTDGLAITVTNVGIRSIPSSLPDADAGSSSVSAWLVPDDGAPRLVARLPLGVDLSPDESWTATLPEATLADLLPATLILALELPGDAGRPGGSPPGVFRIVSAGPPATADSSAAGTSGAAAQAPAIPVPVQIMTVTPADPASDQLLGRASPPRAMANALVAAGMGGSDQVPAVRTALPATPPTSGAASAARRGGTVSYRATVLLKGGFGVISITNTGTGTIHAIRPAAGHDPGGAVPLDGHRPEWTTLLVSAVPVNGTSGASVDLAVPLGVDLPPGESVVVEIRLPALRDAQPTYLVSARLRAGDPAETPTTMPALFWMQGPVPLPSASGAAGTTAGGTIR